MNESLDKPSFQRLNRYMNREKLESYLDDSSDEKFQLLSAMLQDPAYQSKTLYQMAKLCKLSVADLQHLYMDGERQLALLQMSSKLGDIMDDVTVDARSSLETCHRCDGLTVIPFGDNGTRPCPQCKGKGEIRRIGDKHSRDLVFESAKLTGQSSPLVAIQQNFNGNDDRLEDVLKRTRQIVLEPIDGKRTP